MKYHIHLYRMNDKTIFLMLCEQAPVVSGKISSDCVRWWPTNAVSQVIDGNKGNVLWKLGASLLIQQ